MTYNPERLQFELDHQKDLLGIDPRFVQALLYAKAREWS